MGSQKLNTVINKYEGWLKSHSLKYSLNLHWVPATPILTLPGSRLPP